jgi:hypothetical protein
MPDLGEQIRDYVEGIAPPITVSEIAARTAADEPEPLAEVALRVDRRRRRGGLAVAIVGVAAVVALAIGVGIVRHDRESQQVLLGPAPGIGASPATAGTVTAAPAMTPRIWLQPPNPSGYTMQALLRGKLVYDAVDDCFVLESGTAKTPLIWPDGSTATTGPPGVRISERLTVHDGDEVTFGGGYVQAEASYDIPPACRAANGEVAFAQSFS